MALTQNAFVALGLLGFVLTMSCNLQRPILSDMIFKPWVLLDPLYVPRLFGVFIGEQASNSTTIAFFLSFVQLIGSIVIINCRATPDSRGKRFLFHYVGLGVALALSFPLQCALCTQPSKPYADAGAAWFSTVTIVGVGMVALLCLNTDSFITFWYFGVTAMVLAIYERLSGTAEVSSMRAFRLLAAVNLLICVACWSFVMWRCDGTPFATWFTASVFWDFIICTICAVGWVVQHTGDYKIGILTLMCPSAGIPLAMANLFSDTESYTTLKG